MVRDPDPREPDRRRPQDGAPDRDKPIVRITAGSPDHKQLLRALKWLMVQPVGDDEARPQKRRPR